MEMLGGKNKMAWWNVYGLCYVELIIFLNKKTLCFTMHRCIIAYRWEIQEVKCFTKILAPNQWAFCSIVVSKHCIAGDPASSDTLILSVSSPWLEIVQEKIQHYVASIWKS